MGGDCRHRGNVKGISRQDFYILQQACWDKGNVLPEIKQAILKVDKIHSAILLDICGICRPEGNFVGEKFVFFFSPNSGVLLKIKEQKKKIFFSQTNIFQICFCVIVLFNIPTQMFFYYMDLYELNIFFPVFERYQSLFFVCLFWFFKI